MGNIGKTIVVALGGNAIKKAEEKGTAEEQFRNVRETCRQILEIIKRGRRVVITHGNGPQAGNVLIQQEEGSKLVLPQSLDMVGAMTQGQIGYIGWRSSRNDARERKVRRGRGSDRQRFGRRKTG